MADVHDRSEHIPAVTGSTNKIVVAVNRNNEHSRRWNMPSRIVRLGIPSLFLLLAISISPAGESIREMVVQVRSCVMRSGPTFLSSPSGNLAYSENVKVVEEDGPWRKVSSSGGKLSGWIHVTALTPPRAEFKQGTSQAGTRVSSGEVALAGRGFDAEVESKLRQKNKNLNYAGVDKLESLIIRPEDIQAFARKGKLLPMEKR